MFKALFKRGCMAAAVWMALTGAAMAAVDVNTADATALTSVKGIGPATAKNIIDERTKHGPYKSAADLAERVSGVGTKSVARMQEAGLTIGAKAAPAAAAPPSADHAWHPGAKGAAGVPRSFASLFLVSDSMLCHWYGLC